MHSPAHSCICNPRECGPRPSPVNALYRWSALLAALAAFPLQSVGIVVKTEGQYKNRVADNRASKGAPGKLCSIGPECMWEPCVGWSLVSQAASRQTEEAWLWHGVRALRCCAFMCFCGACGWRYVRFGFHMWQMTTVYAKQCEHAFVDQMTLITDSISFDSFGCWDFLFALRIELFHFEIELCAKTFYTGIELILR